MYFPVVCRRPEKKLTFLLFRCVIVSFACKVWKDEGLTVL